MDTGKIKMLKNDYQCTSFILYFYLLESKSTFAAKRQSIFSSIMSVKKITPLKGFTSSADLSFLSFTAHTHTSSVYCSILLFCCFSHSWHHSPVFLHILTCHSTVLRSLSTLIFSAVALLLKCFNGPVYQKTYNR